MKKQNNRVRRHGTAGRLPGQSSCAAPGVTSAGHPPEAVAPAKLGWRAMDQLENAVSDTLAIHSALGDSLAHTCWDLHDQDRFACLLDRTGKHLEEAFYAVCAAWRADRQKLAAIESASEARAPQPPCTGPDETPNRSKEELVISQFPLTEIEEAIQEAAAMIRLSCDLLTASEHSFNVKLTGTEVLGLDKLSRRVMDNLDTAFHAAVAFAKAAAPSAA